MEDIKHAFALGPDPKLARAFPASLERVAQMVVSKKMEIPALIVLETVTPLSFVASQAAAAVLPLLSGLLDVRDLEEAAVALEDRATLRQLIARIEELSGKSGAPC